ncbi:MAG: hypothetical protein IT196_06925 [Acidimicrobiales bacterium]|nr:hypothetical protein [Acidimicrobiales bacterium]
MRIGVSIALASACWMLLGCGQDAVESLRQSTESPSQSVSAPPIVGPANIPVAQSPEWLSLREELIASKRRSQEAIGTMTMLNAGSYAFLSHPVDIRQPGKYELIFDVTSDFNPAAIGYRFPEDTRFHYDAQPMTTPDSFDGTSFKLLVDVKEAEFVPYMAWSVWIF